LTSAAPSLPFCFAASFGPTDMAPAPV
jgi:hypothetical protein